MLTSKDVNFVGYTYKNFDVFKGMHAPVGMIDLPSQPLLLVFDFSWSFLCIICYQQAKRSICSFYPPDLCSKNH
jgi:hypothetical protein